MTEREVSELLESLELGYIECKEGLENNLDENDLAHVKGYCTTLEQILSAYGGVSKEEMLKIKRPIIGDISLRRKKKSDHVSKIQTDYDIPTIFRKQSD